MQLDSPEWQPRHIAPPRAFPALGGDVDGAVLVSYETTVLLWKDRT
jgi:hypothetical protein